MRILVVDDNADSLHSLCLVLRDLGHDPRPMLDARQALEEATANFYPLIISDIRMPGLTGIELLEKLKANPASEGSDVLLITGYADIESAVQALRSGAYDYLNKPINASELSVVVERCAEHQKLLQENITLKHDLDRAEETQQELRNSLVAATEQLLQVTGVGEVVAESPYMRALMDEALIFHANPGVPVLIEGETGTGKEILARLIHYGVESGGARGVETPFVALNCSAIPPELFGSELFGHEPGAFTGSRAEGAAGKLELAGSGTLFLDEISEMPYDMQPKLLRVLEDRTFYRLGGKHERKFKARVICAGNRSLAAMVEAGVFRRDLYHRLSVGHLEIPPLRERPEELFPLVTFFLRREARLKKKKFTGLAPEALELMRAYPWLGNVRELRNAVERAVLLHDDVLLRPEHLSFLIRSLEVAQTAQGRKDSGQVKPFALPAAKPYSDGEGVDNSASGRFFGPPAAHSGNEPTDSAPVRLSLDAERLVLPEDSLDLEAFYDILIRKAVDKFDGNKSKAAEFLNISRFALHRRLKKD